ncbi:Photosynthetic reaction center cytochrome c subunit [Roseibacterium elongatum DSM 19469]|uniref:Photosynthetic reaction center cytochrome c subunit n=1 Tax=Roseicyclus elongatus DSM 19469 TaxID=1294273 RepID=W8RQZ9_9RHOB|nr:photosynthetic reaction center cytochrome PufC [Roseibacterium elongatum]AHM03483.1 Photosynthetic reaction center cytochrome c subunit [Roseibacterium elongatum DSM 19469]
MFPKWFDNWNRENPTNIFGPAVAVGVAGSAVFVAAMLVTWGQPYATDSMQTGPRGTGMHVAEFVSDLEAGDPTIAGYFTSEPVVPTADSERAGDVIEGAEPLLADLSVENYNRLIEAMRSWTGIPDLLEPGLDNYQTTVARRMIQMTQNINQNWAAHVQANAEVGVTCYSCHRGMPVPNNIWYRVSPVNENVAGWSANQNRVTMASNFTSLPSDYLEHYLIENEEGFYNDINVHDLASRVQQQPGDPLIQQTERTYAFMNYISNSLGVNCTFCHNTRAFYDPGQVTPQWATATLGITMVQEIIAEYLLPLQDVLPEERLGPVYADMPLAACRTCHQYEQQPLNGLNVIRNWPELAVLDGEPDYSAFE